MVNRPEFPGIEDESLDGRGGGGGAALPKVMHEKN